LSTHYQSHIIAMVAKCQGFRNRHPPVSLPHAPCHPELHPNNLLLLSLHFLVSESAYPHFVSCPLPHRLVGQSYHRTASILDSERVLECLLVSELRQLDMAWTPPQKKTNLLPLLKHCRVLEWDALGLEPMPESEAAGVHSDVDSGGESTDGQEPPGADGGAYSTDVSETRLHVH
jgi:hypothetical protein